MTLSVIIPVYNVEKYLDECLNSLFPISSNNDIEVICVNDGSTDTSPEILKRWKIRWPGLQIVNQPNGGLSRARNAGLDASVGDYVAFIDSDDFINYQMLLDILEIAQKNNADIAIGDYLEFIDESSNRNYILQHIENAPTTIEPGETFFYKYYKSLRSVVWRSIYRRSFLLSNNLLFHEGIYFEDVEFTPVAFFTAEKVIYTHIPFYYYRKRNQSITTSQSTQRKVNDAISIWKVLDNLALQSPKLAHIVRELGFHCFLKQYSLLTSKISPDTFISAKRLCRHNMFSPKYKLLAVCIQVMPYNIFHRLLTLCK